MRAIETMINQIIMMKNEAKWSRNKNIRAAIVAQIELSAMFFNAALDVMEGKKC